MMPALLCPPWGRDVSADTRTATHSPWSGRAAFAMDDLGRNKAIGATRAGTELCWWWQLSLWVSKRRQRKQDVYNPSSHPSIPSVLLGVTLPSPSPPEKITQQRVYFCINNFQASVSDACGSMGAM